MANFVLDKGFLLNSNSTGVNQYKAVKFISEEEVDVATVAGEQVLGFVQESNIEEGDAGQRVVNVRLIGITRAIAGETSLSAGTNVTVDGSGRVVASTSGDRQCGVVVMGADSVDDHVEVLLTPASTETAS